MEQNFSITLESGEESDHVRFSGIIDINSEEQLQNLADRLCNNMIIFDFSDTGRINSMGVAYLLRCLKKIRQRSDVEITIRGLSPVNAMLFKMTGVFLLAHPE